MWTSSIESIDKGLVRKLTFRRGDTPLSYADVIDGWRNSRDFRDFYLSLLAEAPFEAVFWESPPVSAASVGQAYEFVLIDSPQLAGAEPEPSSFAASFDSAAVGETVVTFENLGKDAVLVVPCPVGSGHAYPHLTAFVRGAPEAQRHELFRKLGEAISRSLIDRPLWVSTSGLGVFWLHLRLDSRPKYYNFRPYTG